MMVAGATFQSIVTSWDGPAFEAGQKWAEQVDDHEQLRRACVDLSSDELPSDLGEIEPFLMGARSVWNNFATQNEPESVVPMDFGEMSVYQRRCWALLTERMLRRRIGRRF
jgi:hypothetical protein